MNAQLERLLPILSTIPGVNLPVTMLQGVFIAASQRKIEQLESALRYEVGLLNQKIMAGQLLLDREYVRSESFTANVMQAMRAAEIAESDHKLQFIARALAGCSLSFPRPEPDKFQTMRIVEAMSDRELRVFVAYFQLLDPVDPYSDAIPTDAQLSLPPLSRQEVVAALLGLQQLGVISKENLTGRDGEWKDAPHLPGQGFAWKLTGLARQVATLGRLGLEEA
ncbi:hypothetical protein DKM44_12040 [Deinococcus irradiatisoli]|uniref:DUF4393 domain-containing protein n=1 Tax=Deinococcus irradiatisoli TaxID=2202254 RepID=A0A2Z3JFA4_9DEIO|nr:hypothetical protein [Deinococcus irradiatisoli]AWN23867.1 hypothetical protein DKM44_12040 [Deinococcus irradiatisoli]